VKSSAAYRERLKKAKAAADARQSETGVP